MEGKIVKAIAGFYYVDTGEKIYACRARGILRRGDKPLVGDDCLFSVLSQEDGEGSLTKLLPRNNSLIRPAAANIDQALLVFALRDPDPNLNLLDRFLIYLSMHRIPAAVFFNKQDLDTEHQAGQYRDIYEKAGCRVLFGSLNGTDGEPLAEIRNLMKGRTTVLAGPSGAGKSSLTNLLSREAHMEVGALSAKIRRGKQTTRHTELFSLGNHTYFLDTPGFTSLEIPGLRPEDVRLYYPEFEKASAECRFSGCLHLKESSDICGVKRAVLAGHISQVRYDSYVQICAEQQALKGY